jgi:hypothetical protein
MNSELLNIIGQERQRYVDFFIHETDSLKKGKDICATELQIQTNDESISYPFNIIYLDFIYKDKKQKDHILELRLDKNLSYKSYDFYLDSLKVELGPFCWNSCEFTVDKIKVSALGDWVVKWLKIDEEIPDIDLAEAIHSCSEPILVDNKYSFTIDFGSAPETCFIEFLQFLCDNNVEKVSIKTSEV